MARIRTVKPDFFRHAGLYDLEAESGLPIRIAFAGLWTACDREGRFDWKPRELKLDCLPYDNVDFSRVLDALASRGFVVKYASKTGELYGVVPSFRRHQVINNKETPSSRPDPDDAKKCGVISSDYASREPRVELAIITPLSQPLMEGKGKEEEGKDSVPNGTGAKAPDPGKAVWDLGVSILTATGMTDPQARKMIGKWLSGGKTLGALFDAFTACGKASSQDPIPFIQTCLDRTSRPGPQTLFDREAEQKRKIREDAHRDLRA